MSDVSQGPGWWQASDGKWYPPEQAPSQPPAAGGPTGAPPAGQAPTGPPPSGPPAGFGAPGGGPPAYGAQGASAPGTPGGGAGQLAEWPERALGGLIDYFGIGILAVILSAASTTLGYLVSLLGLAWAIYNGYLNGTTGRSVGKKVVGLKVISEETGQPIGGGQGVLRYFAHIIDAIICYIGFLFPLWDAKKQTISDKILKTVVITGQPKVPFAEAIKPD